MRLLQRQADGNITLTGPFSRGNIPPYAILSHTWGTPEEEVTFQVMELRDGTARKKRGYKKIEFCVNRAKKVGLEYSWVDTCCIDKTNSVELGAAINSMFVWYQKSERCFVYL